MKQFKWKIYEHQILKQGTIKSFQAKDHQSFLLWEEIGIWNS